MPQAFCKVFMKMTMAISKALFKMYCYTQCAHLAVHDYILKGKSSSSFRETGQDTPICKECFHFDNYNGLMNLLQKSDKFEIHASPAISFIAEGDEDAEDEPPPRRRIFQMIGTPLINNRNNNTSSNFRKANEYNLKRMLQETFFPKLLERVKC